MIALIFPILGPYMKKKQVKYPLHLEKLNIIHHKHECFSNFKTLMSNFDCYFVCWYCINVWCFNLLKSKRKNRSVSLNVKHLNSFKQNEDKWEMNTSKSSKKNDEISRIHLYHRMQVKGYCKHEKIHTLFLTALKNWKNDA